MTDKPHNRIPYSICHVNLARGFRGGERQTQLLIAALAQRGITQQLLVRDGSPLLSKLSGTPGLTLYPAKRPYWRNFSIVRKHRPQIVHAHEAKAAQWAFLNALICRTPYLITRRISKPPKNVWLTRAVYKHAAAVVALSTAIQASLKNLCATDRVSIIPSMYASLPVDQNALRDLRERYASHFVIGNVAALVNAHKGQAVLIDAMRILNQKYTDLKCLFIGTGMDEMILRCRASDLANIEFIGFVDEVGTWIELFDLFVFPSLQEGLGSTLLDVMQHGKPIIASGVDGILDVIQEQKNGLLVPPLQAEKLAAAIEKLYLDSDLRERLVQAGYAELPRYAPDTVAEQYCELYQALTTNDDNNLA